MKSRLGPPLALAGLFIVHTGTFAQSIGPLKAALDPILDASPMENAWWGAVVVDVESGDVLYTRNGGRSFVPASNAKLFTTAAALDLLGPDYRWVTNVYIDGNVVHGELQGNLIVRGSGDPSIGARYSNGDPTRVFRAWADSLRRAGIRVIRGDVIGDDDVFDDVPYGEAWSWDDEQFAYATAINGLPFNDNVIDVTITARRASEPGNVSWEPDRTDYVVIVNRTITTQSGTRLKEGYKRRRGTNIIELTSKVPQGRIDHESLSVHNPTGYFVHVLRQTLQREGIAIDGRAVDVDELSIRPQYSNPRYRRIASYQSPPLSVIAETVNTESQNLYAELLLRTLGVEMPLQNSGNRETGSAEAGLQVAQATYLAAGVDTSRLQLVDGSGLSRKNLVTPNMTAALLRYMASHEEAAVREAFIGSLAVGGQTGTLAWRFRNGPEVRAKTGSLGNISSLAGYVTSQSGALLVFVLMCNNHTVKQSVIRRTQDRVVTRVATWR